ncbi:MAG: methionine--tRNA ligase [candidate division Zixibacteria bacterium]|nr:methionine--tRNA ligase [Candidatus Tariuqbacter arcticus]
MPVDFYITTPIYYVNGEPHLGHAYTTILADVLNRYHRLFSDEVYFLTGTDEHGQKVQEAALELNLPPKEHCDRMVLHFIRLWEKLGIDYSDFIRTTEERHITVVQEILQRIMDKGDIYQDEFEGWYCVVDERYFTDKDLIDGNCPLCGREVNRMREMNYFFKMSAYTRWLIDYIEEHPRFILPDFRRNEVLGFLRQPTRDLCISRPKSRLSWGITLPFDEDYVTYVWFDALLNYYSAVKDKGLWPATVHLIGKDILTTHAVYWPIMLKAADLELPQTIFAHGWWLVEEAKMSKSLGNVVKPLDMVDMYGVEQFKYFLMREMSPGSDASFSEELLVKGINADLANDLGNLLSRLTTLVNRNYDGIIPNGGEVDEEWRRLGESCVLMLKDALKNFRMDEIVKLAMTPVRRANKYLEETSPWRLVKQDKNAAGRALFNALEALRLTSVLLKPIMPGKCRDILQRLRAEKTGLNWGELNAGCKIIKGEAIFPRIVKEIPPPDKEVKKAPTVEENVITFQDFERVEMKVAEIVAAEKVEGAEKLLKLQVDLGIEKRQLVAGIARYYSMDELPGKKIIVVANLKKVKIRGVESQGMLLAAVKGKTMRLLTVDGEIPNGTKVL